MYQLFNTPPSGTRGGLSLPRLEHYQGRLRDSLDRVKGYYRQSHTGVPNHHPIVKLLGNLPLGLEMDERAYYDMIGDRSEYLVRLLNFTNATQSSYPLEGVFTHSGNHEVILAHKQSWQWMDYQGDSWRECQPLRFVRHPDTHFSMELPNGRMTPYTQGMVVILIDIPMLMCQYRRWVQDQIERLGDDAHDRDWFVTTVVFPNMIDSWLDVAFANRLMMRYQDNEVITENASHHPFTVNRYYQEMDQQLDNLIVQINRRPLGWDQLLTVIPAIRKETLQEVFQLPSLLVNRQNQWALVVARAALIEWLVLYDQVVSSRRNRDEANVIKRTLRRIESDRSFDRRLEDNDLSKLMDQLDTIETLLD